VTCAGGRVALAPAAAGALAGAPAVVGESALGAPGAPRSEVVLANRKPTIAITAITAHSTRCFTART
jgi:hypothetical protein